LVWLLNAPLIKYWFRWVLRIHKDTQPSDRIVELTPGDYKIFCGYEEDGRAIFKADFRTNEKFGRRMYHAFKPLWKLCHLWDTLFANNFIPELNLGFDTTTVYADPDAEVRQVFAAAGDTWANLYGGAGNQISGAGTESDFHRVIHGSTSGKWYYMVRYGLVFPTSTIGAGYICSSGTFGVYATNKVDGNNDLPSTNIYSWSPADPVNLAATDFANCGSDAFCDTAIAYGNWTVGYKTFVLNSTGTAWVDLEGYTNISIRNANYDVANTAPTWNAAQDWEIIGYTANQGGTSQDPYLQLTYGAAPSTGHDFTTLLGVT
jgi:hypothetical protein